MIGLESGDGTRVRIPVAQAMEFETIVDLMPEYDVDEYIPVPSSVDGKTLVYITTSLRDARDVPVITRDNEALAVRAIHALAVLSSKTLLDAFLVRVADVLNAMTDVQLARNLVAQLDPTLITHYVFFLTRLRELPRFFKRYFSHVPRLNDWVQKVAASRAFERLNENWALEWAATEGRVVVLEFLLAYRDPSSNNNAPLMLAIQYGHRNVVETLLADPRVDPSASIAKLWIIVNASKSVEILDALLRDGRADPAYNDNALLITLVEHNRLLMVKRVLKDARVDPTTHNSWVVYAACRRAQIFMLDTLLRDGRADPAAVDNRALLAAVKSKCVQCIHLLLKTPGVNAMAGDGAVLQFAKDGNHPSLLRYF